MTYYLLGLAAVSRVSGLITGDPKDSTWVLPFAKQPLYHLATAFCYMLLNSRTVAVHRYFNNLVQAI